MVLVQRAGRGVDDEHGRRGHAYGKGSSVTLQSSAPGGLSSLDALAIRLGGQSVTPSGVATGRPVHSRVDVTGKVAEVTVAPGTAQAITVSR